MRRLLLVICVCVWAAAGALADDAKFKVGFGERDITPKAPMPMWGYGARHNLLSQGVLEPLMAKTVVIEADGQRMAIMGLDIGRGPTEPMMEKIRKEVAEKSGVDTVFISGSHTHHGPVIELTDEDGFGKGKYDDAVAYSKRLPELLIEAIVEAAGNLEPARMGIAKKDLEMNRNRHTKQTPKPTDPMLAVMRFDSLDGKPLAIVVNYAAHPVTLDGSVLKFSPDYPGHLQNRVESALGTHCLFMQGAAGDMSPNRGDLDTKGYGEALGNHVVALAQSVETKVPEKPSIKARVDKFNFTSRVDFNNRVLIAMYQGAFFPELVNNFAREYRDGVRPELTTVLLNGDTALVGASGEFFSNHSNRLKARAYLPHTLFFGYCNGHHMYFPTIEAASEGGYGADAQVSMVEIGAGEMMMNQALVNIYTMLGKFPPETIKP
jgi:Neutral/alkaline non-lysosomal ceramidase, N-terminal